MTNQSDNRKNGTEDRMEGITPETLVQTSRGLRKIKYITAGDEVLTHRRRYRRVSDVAQSQGTALSCVQTALTGELLVARTHPFYARKMMFPPDYTGDKSTLFYSMPCFIQANHLDDTFHVGVAINQEAQLPNLLEELHIGLSDWVHTKEFWWLMGKYMRIGTLAPVHLDGTAGVVQRPTLNVSSVRTYEVVALLERLTIPHQVTMHEHYSRIVLTSERLSRYMETFGLAPVERWIDERITHLPVAHLRTWVQGYLNDVKRVAIDGRITLDNVRSHNAYVFGHCLAKAYQVGYTVTQAVEDTYTLSFSLYPHAQTDDAFYDDGYIWFPIQSVSHEEYEGSLYNLVVDDDDSFTACNVVVHDVKEK